MYLLTLPGGSELLIILFYVGILITYMFDVAESGFLLWHRVVLLI